MPEISIIVPVYNVEKYIHRCVDSILAQTFTDFEMILVDDGSPDNCGAICDEYAERDSRIKVIHKQNGGVSAARNTALDIAKGIYITFCDSDDYWERDWLSSLYTSIVTNSVDSVAAGYQYVSEDNMQLKIHECKKNIYSFTSIEDKLNFLTHNVFYNVLGWAVWSRIFRASLIHEYHIRFCESCSNFAEDLGFAIEYTLCSTSASSITSTGYYYVQRKESMMHQSEDIVKLDAVNEISKHVWMRCRKMELKEQREIPFPIIHFLIMNCQYCKIINSVKYSRLGDEIEKITDKKWFFHQTRALFRNYNQMKKLFGKANARRILLLSNYCLHRCWQRFQLESAFYYKVVAKI